MSAKIKKQNQNNQQVLLDHVIERLHAERAPQISSDSFFEIFVAEQLLKDFDLSDEQIASGLVDGANDGGIDGFYTFVNDELIVEDTDLSSFGKKDITINVVIFQAKSSDSFSETAIDKLNNTLSDLLDLQKPLSKFAVLYNQELIKAAEIFRSTIKALAAAFPQRIFSIYYASKGIDIHQKVSTKAVKLQQSVKTLFSDSSSSCNVEIVHAGMLYELAQKTPNTTREIILSDKLDSKSGGIIGLVKIKDYIDFLTDDKKKLRRSLFEANVRDYQGKVEVNKDIQECLSARWPEEFWWLNNGITIVVNKINVVGKVLTLESPQIVNGLQTSREIFRYFENGNTANEEREVLVRILSPKTSESRDRIIKATNSQTAISAASLRATDLIQRHIEEYLKPFGLYYDRRKNFYKNENRPSDKIISIPYMAQALMAIVLQQPDTARARPSSLLKKDSDYIKVFNPAYPIEVFKVVVSLTRAAEKKLETDNSLSKEDRVNLKYYLALHLAATECKSAKPKTQKLKALLERIPSDSTLTHCLTEVKAIYEKLGANSNVAKGSEFRELLIKSLEKKFSKKIGK